jgi:hypothetical protein
MKALGLIVPFQNINSFEYKATGGNFFIDTQYICSRVGKHLGSAASLRLLALRSKNLSTPEFFLSIYLFWH